MARKLLPISLMAACCVLCSVPMGSADEATGHILGGSLDSPIRIEVFSDFQCPACRELYLGTMRQVLEEYSSKDKVCVIYHEFPLAMHQYAKDAARYSEAAGRLGQQKLRSVYESLFTDQAQWSKDGSLELTIAKTLTGEDLQKLRKFLLEPSINADIEKAIQTGINKEIRSTPTLLITYPGKQQKVEGVVAYAVLKQFIDSIVK